MTSVILKETLSKVTNRSNDLKRSLGSGYGPSLDADHGSGYLGKDVRTVWKGKGTEFENSSLM